MRVNSQLLDTCKRDPKTEKVESTRTPDPFRLYVFGLSVERVS